MNISREELRRQEYDALLPDLEAIQHRLTADGIDASAELDFTRFDTGTGVTLIVVTVMHGSVAEIRVTAEQLVAAPDRVRVRPYRPPADATRHAIDWIINNAMGIQPTHVTSVAPDSRGYVDVKLNRVDSEFAEWIRSTLGDIVRVDPVPWGSSILALPATDPRMKR